MPPSVADLARATLEGVAFQVADLIEAMNDDLGTPLSDIRVDGGMARSDPFLQFQADLLDLPIQRSPQTESTALGAALLAGIGAGLWAEPGRRHRARFRSASRSFRPADATRLARPRPPPLAQGGREHAEVCQRVSWSWESCERGSQGRSAHLSRLIDLPPARAAWAAASRAIGTRNGEQET